MLSLKTIQENVEQKTNSTTKPKKSLKHDFSFVNWGEATEQWSKEVKKWYTALFLEVSKQARILAGIKVKATDTGTEGSESGTDSSGRDLDSDYEGFGKGTNIDCDDNHQNKADPDAEWNGDHDGDTEQTNSGNHRLEDNEDDGEQGDHGYGAGDNGDGGQQSDNEAGSELSYLTDWY